MYPMSNQWWRLGGAFGVGFIILFVIGIILQSGVPYYDDPIEETREFWVDDGQRYLVADYLLGLGFVLFFLPFIVILRELLARAEGAVPIWSRVGFTAGVISIAVGGAASFFWGALAFGDLAETASDSEINALMALDVYGYATVSLGFGTFALASSLVIALTGVLWRWAGWLGIVVGIAVLVSGLGILSADSDDVFDIIGLISFLALAVWILVTSIAMWMRKEAPVAEAL